MIHALSISDFVLVRQLTLDVSSGFTSLTGETGAGKSILLEAIGAALGERNVRRFVRTGADRATISISFDVPILSPVWAALDEAGLAVDPSEGLTLRRVIPANGATRCFVNDQSVSAALIAELGSHLVEIHGQHAAIGLMDPARHRDLLDLYAGTDSLLATCKQAWEALKVARTELVEAAQIRAAIDERLNDLESSRDELEEIAPVPGELALLEGERQILLQADQIGEALTEAETLLDNGQAESLLSRVIALVEQTLRRLEDGPETDRQRVDGVRAAFERALIECEEGRRGLADISGLAERDPERLDRVENRLATLRRAARKFGCAPEDLTIFYERVCSELAATQTRQADLAGLEEAEMRMRELWHGAADALSKARQHAARRLEASVAEELPPLKLDKMCFRLRIEPLPDSACGPHGQDQVEIEVAPNPGLGFGPLRKIASGGELARVSLALKCALADAGEAGTLIFDEADQGVGGAVAAAIGERLARLSEKRQVLTITHSPQVAAAADTQWRIEKSVAPEGLGETHVTVLDEGARRAEIARMLSGAVVTREAEAAAVRLLETV